MQFLLRGLVVLSKACYLNLHVWCDQILWFTFYCAQMFCNFLLLCTRKISYDISGNPFLHVGDFSFVVMIGNIQIWIRGLFFNMKLCFHAISWENLGCLCMRKRLHHQTMPHKGQYPDLVWMLFRIFNVLTFIGLTNWKVRGFKDTQQEFHVGCCHVLYSRVTINLHIISKYNLQYWDLCINYYSLCWWRWFWIPFVFSLVHINALMISRW